MIVCGGDGFADIFGRRYGTVKLPWNSDKSWAGSSAMFIGAWTLSTLVLLLFSWLGLISPWQSQPLIWLWIGLIIGAATLVESFRH